MKQLRIRKELGTWYYKKIQDYDMEFPQYVLYNDRHEMVSTFSHYNDMKYYIETGIII